MLRRSFEIDFRHGTPLIPFKEIFAMVSSGWKSSQCTPYFRLQPKTPDAATDWRLSKCPLPHPDQANAIRLGSLHIGHQQTSLVLGPTDLALIALCILTLRCREFEGFRTQYSVHPHNCP